MRRLHRLAKDLSYISLIVMLMGSQNLVAQPCISQLDHLIDKLIDVNEAAKDGWWKWTTTPSDWSNSVYHIGNMALYRTLLEEHRTAKANEYLERSRHWAKTNEWNIGPLNQFNEDRYADRVAAGQVYVELDDAGVPDADLEPITEAIAPRHPEPTREEEGLGEMSLWWVDALFMAGPLFSKFCDRTGDFTYCNRLDDMYNYTNNTLYNSNTGLWYARPAKKQIDEYWLRGNGWAIAAMARMLADLPSQHDGQRYRNMLQAMADALEPLQRSDGFWNVDLLSNDSPFVYFRN